MRDFRVIFIAVAFLVLVLLASFLVSSAIWGEKEAPRAEIPLPTTFSYAQKPSPSRFFGKIGAPSPYKPEELLSAPTAGVDPLADVLDPETIIDTVSPFLPAPPVSRDERGENVVENLFPKQYIASLHRMQDAFVGAGWMKTDEKSTLATENDVQQFLERAVEILIAQGAYPSEAYAQSARAAVRQFPKLWESERELLRPGRTGFLPSSSYERKRGNILDGLLSAIFPKEAHAQVSDWIDDFVTLPDCWKAKDRLNFTGGSNLWAFCCNCGMLIIPPYVYEFYWDCDKEDESKCNVPMGCLNAVCAGEYNAIFDGPPGYEVRATAGWGGGTNIDYSFTCGCDASTNGGL